MSTTIDTVACVVETAPSYSSQWSWRVTAVVNGQRTTCNCMHSHKRQDLAEQCVRRHFTEVADEMLGAELVDLGGGLLEARWADQGGRQVARRFRFLPALPVR